MINIRVAVRIRPFSQRESFQNDVSVIKKEDKWILVTNPKLSGKQDGDARKKSHRFNVDYCYDSRNPETSSQEAVYREIGTEVLDSMFKGFNACVLAYGHSASGKTYTMMGVPNDPGLTPRICTGLFDGIDSKSNIQYQVAASFLEIYNEKVRDLLAKDEEGYNFSLRIREHPKLGPYVQDLTQHLVTEKSRLLELLNFGNGRRSTATTENNIHSSRSHAVFTLRIRQTNEEGYEIEKFSKVHLVDLAGSERASGSQNKTRLKEGANINKSLVALGNVISALAENCETAIVKKEHSTLKTWQPFVPYRDSVLTWLLKDTLGGNSNTIMIATVSPASSCLNETVNTLRYAKRTKKIVNRPMINEDPKSRTIRELREEIIRLKFLLKSYCKNFDPTLEISDEVNKINLAEENNSEDGVRKWQTPIEKEVRRSKQEEDDSVMENSKRPETKVENSKKSPSSKNGGHEIDDSFQLKNRRSRGENREEKKLKKSSFSHEPLETQAVIALENDSREINDEKVSDANGLEWMLMDRREANIFSDDSESFSSSPLEWNNLINGEGSKRTETADGLNLENAENSVLFETDIPEYCTEHETTGKFRMKKKETREKARELISRETLPSAKVVAKEGLTTFVGMSSSYAYISNAASFNKMATDHAAQRGNNKKGKTRLRVGKSESEDERKAARRVEEMKMCKRAISRESRKGTEANKKTVDRDTQTNFGNGTRRAKGKSAVTDEWRALKFARNSATNTNSDECVETKREWAEIDENDECFSEDSLDKEESETNDDVAADRHNATFDQRKISAENRRISQDVGDSEPRGIRSRHSFQISQPFYESKAWKNVSTKTSTSFTSPKRNVMQSTADASSSETSSEDFAFNETEEDETDGMTENEEGELHAIGENGGRDLFGNAFASMRNKKSSCYGSRRLSSTLLNLNNGSERVTRKFFEPKELNWNGKNKGKLDAENETHSLFSSGHDKTVNDLAKESDDKKWMKANEPKVADQTDKVGKTKTTRVNGFYLTEASRKSIESTDRETNDRTELVKISDSANGSQFSDSFVFKKDRGTETTFGSDDSIIFVFAGPAEPKATLLMEATIARKLNAPAEDDVDSTRRKCRKKSVEVAKLIRPVSVDTALAALTRMAIRPFRHVSRTVSLENFPPKRETFFIPERARSSEGRKVQNESRCRCDMDKKCDEIRTGEKPLRYSVSTNTSRDQQTETVNRTDEEELLENLDELKLKKWKTERVAESNEENDSNSQTRRVRFSDPGPQLFHKESINKSIDSMRSVLLKKTTAPLKTQFSYFKLPTSEGDDQSKSDTFDRFAQGIETAEKLHPGTESKPGKGVGSTFFTQPATFSPILINRRHQSNGFSDPSKNRSNTPEFGESGERRKEGSDEFSTFNHSKTESIRELEAELEQSCRRLKLAAEQDETRQEISERKHCEREGDSNEWNRISVCDAETSREREKRKKQKEPAKRRKTNECAYECVCKKEVNHETRACTGSKAFRSTLELDTFGPGTNHCFRLCLFCRKNDADLYWSNPSLNSVCTPGQCRLDYYGHCPCTPVKLAHVSPSPRAYMQHLLTLRRRIVRKTKISSISHVSFPSQDQTNRFVDGQQPNSIQFI